VIYAGEVRPWLKGSFLLAGDMVCATNVLKREAEA